MIAILFRFWPYIAAGILILGLGLMVNHWRIEANKVEALENKVTLLESNIEARDIRDKEAAERIAFDNLRKDSQTNKVKTLRKQNAETPNIVISPSKLRAIQDADA